MDAHAPRTEIRVQLDFFRNPAQALDRNCHAVVYRGGFARPILEYYDMQVWMSRS